MRAILQELYFPDETGMQRERSETVIKLGRQRLTLSRVTLSSTIRPPGAHVSSLRPKYHGRSLQLPPLSPLSHSNTLSSACGEFKKISI